MKRKLSILYLTKYDRMGASSRYRSLQYLPLLRAHGIDCVTSPLFDDAYLCRRYQQGKGSAGDLCKALWRRLAVLASVRRYDVLFIEKELVPYFPAWLEKLLSLWGVPFVADYDDALFHQYDQSRNPAVRSVLAGKIASVMRHSRLVTAGNSYLARYATLSGARRVEVIPTVLDLERYPQPVPAGNACFTIGWIGSPSTSAYLGEIAVPLAEICRGGRARVVLIGADRCDLPGVPVEILPWSAESEAADLASCDVGIMPLPDTPWTRGKCGLKLIQYMACGLPVVASPVGVNSEIVDHGVNGFLAREDREWVRTLTLLRDDGDLRLAMGRAGREKVERAYSLEVVAPKVVKILKEVAGASP